MKLWRKKNYKKFKFGDTWYKFACWSAKCTCESCASIVIPQFKGMTVSMKTQWKLYSIVLYWQLFFWVQACAVPKSYKGHFRNLLVIRVFLDIFECSFFLSYTTVIRHSGNYMKEYVHYQGKSWIFTSTHFMLKLAISIVRPLGRY